MKRESDIIKTKSGDLKITFIGHSSLMLEYNETVIHIDPWTNLADYSLLPKADLILLTHEHFDHLDNEALSILRKETTRIVCTALCVPVLDTETTAPKVLRNGENADFYGFLVEAVPAYNIHSKYHPEGEGNGYILNLGETRLYIAGDTDNNPDVKELKNIDIAFLPMNMPYTMTPAMTADAAKSINPGILYPYHYGDTDTGELKKLLGKTDIDIRIRRMA